MEMRKIQKAVHILVVLLVILYILTGFGITNYQMVQPLTLGVLTKALSQQIHSVLALPFVIVLALHMYFAWFRKNEAVK
jgi:cytochrome b subunit of formate dehydrogenase